jgi:hypothetical protein
MRTCGALQERVLAVSVRRANLMITFHATAHINFACEFGRQEEH